MSVNRMVQQSQHDYRAWQHQVDNNAAADRHYDNQKALRKRWEEEDKQKKLAEKLAEENKRSVAQEGVCARNGLANIFFNQLPPEEKPFCKEWGDPYLYMLLTPQERDFYKTLSPKNRESYRGDSPFLRKFYQQRVERYQRIYALSTGNERGLLDSLKTEDYLIFIYTEILSPNEREFCISLTLDNAKDYLNLSRTEQQKFQARIENYRNFHKQCVGEERVFLDGLPGDDRLSYVDLSQDERNFYRALDPEARGRYKKLLKTDRKEFQEHHLFCASVNEEEKTFVERLSQKERYFYRHLSIQERAFYQRLSEKEAEFYQTLSQEERMHYINKLREERVFLRKLEPTERNIYYKLDEPRLLEYRALGKEIQSLRRDRLVRETDDQLDAIFQKGHQIASNDQDLYKKLEQYRSICHCYGLCSPTAKEVYEQLSIQTQKIYGQLPIMRNDDNMRALAELLESKRYVQKLSEESDLALFNSLTNPEKLIYLVLTQDERILYKSFHKSVRPTYRVLSENERNFYDTFSQRGRYVYWALPPGEQASYRTLNQQDRERYDERHITWLCGEMNPQKADTTLCLIS